MIVPMKKVSLVVMDKNREPFLEKLREVGVVHLQKQEVNSAILSDLLEQKARAENALGLLRLYCKKKSEAGGSASGKGIPVQELIGRVLSLEEKRKALMEQRIVYARERSRIEKWGNFNPHQIKELADAGITLILYELAKRKYDSLGNDEKVIVLRSDKVTVLVAALHPIEGETSFVLPDKSLAELDAAIAQIAKDAAAGESQFSAWAVGGIESITAELVQVSQSIEFEMAKIGMLASEDTPREFSVAGVSGYVPAENLGSLKRAAVENGWALVADDPTEEDKPPTLIKNNAFTRLIQPLFQLLGTVPGYREYDISLSYLLFFSVFFAMIFGDAGYGSVLLGLALIFGFKSAQKTGKIPDLFLFLGLMGVCTVVWGSLTGSWFAVSQDALPGVFRALILPPFKAELGTATVQLHVKLFCFILGITQLLVAHIKNFLKYFPKLAALGQVGWIMVELGCFLLVLAMVLDMKTLTWPVYIEDVFSVAFPLAGAGVGIFLIFSQQFGGNFFVNLGKSFANIIPTCLNAVSGFSDIVSYIRLFAVGLAGSAIAESFNGLSGFTSGQPLHIVGALMGVLVLIAGHGLNFAMNLLSVMVHGVRLNLLEYSGHLGNEWSGYKYAPFALKAKTRTE